MRADFRSDLVGSRPVVRHPWPVLSRPVLARPVIWPVLPRAVLTWPRLPRPWLARVVLAWYWPDGTAPVPALPRSPLAWSPLARSPLARSAGAGSGVAGPGVLLTALAGAVRRPAGPVGLSLAGGSRPVPRGGPGRPASRPPLLLGAPAWPARGAIVEALT
jgi:hypothetical protein